MTAERVAEMADILNLMAGKSRGWIDADDVSMVNGLRREEFGGHITKTQVRKNDIVIDMTYMEPPFSSKPVIAYELKKIYP